MWIVQLALRQPHTVVVMAFLIAIFGVVSGLQMAIDIFPVINKPIVSCVWTYTGMSPRNVEQLITTVSERAFTSTVNGIEHMESMSLNGMAIIKIFLHPNTNLGQAVGMVTSVGNAILKQLPPNMSPPVVTQSSATDVPVLQLGLSSPSLSEAKLFDLANSFIRMQFAVVQGATIPFPAGGKYRQVCVDLNPKALVGYGLTAMDVLNAINTQNIIAPSGTVKMGSHEYVITLNNLPKVIDVLNNMPVKHVDNATIYVRDLAYVHDGYQPQLNIVNKDGRRAVIMNILRNGTASTLRVVNSIKFILPRVRQTLPPDCKLDILTDQSKFVSECVEEVGQEAITAAGLTGLFMLAILGSWRSTLIVITSIPLAMMCSVIGLYLTGQTINSMTLGGLALAVGMLVDDATVEVENTHKHVELGKPLVQCVLDSANEVAKPAFVSTLAICLVFVPVVFLTEPARSLFVPLGMAVAFAMMASYGLSRTIVPLMCRTLLGAEHKAQEEKRAREESGESHGKPSFFGTIHNFIEHNFEAFRHFYKGVITWALARRTSVVAGFLIFYACSFCMLPFIGRDFFPYIDAGQLRLHINAPPGTRVEETNVYFSKIERAIRGIIEPSDLKMITDNIGMPVNGVNYAFSDSQTISEADGEILITLNEEHEKSTLDYMREIRAKIAEQFPDCTLYFQPADIVTQILNAGLPSPIDIQVMGFNQAANYKIAQEIRRKVAKVRGAVDVCLHQVVNAPQYVYNVDRTRANQLGISQKDISNNMLINLSSSFQVFPNFWPNTTNGVTYNLAVQTPQREVTSVESMNNTSVAVTPQSPTQDNQSPSADKTQLLSNVARPERSYTPAVVNHLNVQPVYNIYAATQDRDLGGVSDDIEQILKESRKHLSRGAQIIIRGQVLSMTQAFQALIFGLFFAILLVYLLLVVNYQSWLDPLIILMAIPGALSGILWALFVTQTTFTIPALMGTMMTVGVASANSILLINFAKEELHKVKDPVQAALNAGFLRFRPVIMTACAMIIGMIPMATSSGQNAPIGKAVIGGLSVATFSTLIFVPLMYAVLRTWFPDKQEPVDPLLLEK